MVIIMKKEKNFLLLHIYKKLKRKVNLNYSINYLFKKLNV